MSEWYCFLSVRWWQAKFTAKFQVGIAEKTKGTFGCTPTCNLIEYFLKNRWSVAKTMQNWKNHQVEYQFPEFPRPQTVPPMIVSFHAQSKAKPLFISNFHTNPNSPRKSITTTKAAKLLQPQLDIPPQKKEKKNHNKRFGYLQKLKLGTETVPRRGREASERLFLRRNRPHRHDPSASRARNWKGKLQELRFFCRRTEGEWEERWDRLPRWLLPSPWNPSEFEDRRIWKWPPPNLRLLWGRRTTPFQSGRGRFRPGSVVAGKSKGLGGIWAVLAGNWSLNWRGWSMIAS